MSNPLDRIACLPLETRKNLIANLDRFDQLDPQARQAVAALDAEIQALEPQERARYLDTLRRFHLWLESLPQSERDAVRNAPLDERPAEIARLHQLAMSRRQQNLAKSPRISVPAPPLAGAIPIPISRNDLIQISALAPMTLQETAIWLKVWFALEPAERDELEKASDPAVASRRVEEILRARRKDIILELGDSLKLDKAPFRRELGALAKNRLRQEKTAARDKLALFTEARILSLSANDKPVDRASLELFEAAMPRRIRESLDSLPPDAAIRRLAILYRLVFSNDQEIPKPVAPARKSASPSGSPPSKPAAVF
jgi:hypothetical protein